MNLAPAQDKQKEITFFDGHAANDSYDVFTPESSARLIDAIARLGQFKRGDRLADLGCGSGVFTDLLHKRGFSPTGLDISPKLIALGQQKYPGVEFLEGDVEKLKKWVVLAGTTEEAEAREAIAGATGQTG